MNLDHFVILLSDLKACLPFYEKLLPLIGFSKQKDHVFGNAQEIYIDFRQAQKPDHAYHRYAPGLNHIGFTAPDHQALVDIQTAMADAGFGAPDIQEFKDGSALFLKDKDGMRVEVSCYSENL